MGFLNKFLGRAPIPTKEAQSPFTFSFLGGLAFDGVVNSDTAMRHTAVYTCVDIIASSLASVALNVYKRDEGKRVLAQNHPLYEILKYSPNPYLTRFDYIRMWAQDILLRGNHYSQIVRNQKGEIIGLYPLKADNMQVKLTTKGQKVFIYKTAEKEYALTQDEVFHTLGLPGPDGLTGIQPTHLKY